MKIKIEVEFEAYEDCFTTFVKINRGSRASKNKNKDKENKKEGK